MATSLASCHPAGNPGGGGPGTGTAESRACKATKSLGNDGGEGSSVEVGKGGVEKRAEAEGVKTVQEVEGGACGTFWAFRIVILWPRTIFICSRSSSEMVLS